MFTGDLQGSATPIQILTADSVLEGDLYAPEGALSLIIFAHSGGQNRYSPVGLRMVERYLPPQCGALLLNLLTEEEDALERESGAFGSDLEGLGERLVEATEWIAGNPDTVDFSLGYFASGAAAGAALWAASARPELIRAMVTCGGRPDRAAGRLERVKARTLMLVGGREAAEVNSRLAASQAQASKALKRVEVVQAAGPGPEDEADLERPARLAMGWFERYLLGPAGRAA